MNFSGFGNDPMAGDQIGHRVGSHRSGHGPGYARISHHPGNILVAYQPPCRNVQQDLPDIDLKIGAFENQMKGTRPVIAGKEDLFRHRCNKAGILGKTCIGPAPLTNRAMGLKAWGLLLFLSVIWEYFSHGSFEQDRPLLPDRLGQTHLRNLY